MNGAQGTSKAWLMRRSEFPYVVEIAAHVRGQQVMCDFHARRGIRAQPVHGKHKDGRRYTRWRFASLTLLDRWWRDDRARLG